MGFYVRDEGQMSLFGDFLSSLYLVFIYLKEAECDNDEIVKIDS